MEMKEMIARVGDILTQSGIESICLTSEEIVRCKDCKHSYGRGRGMYCQFIECEKTGAFHKEDWFCADGKKKEDQ